MEHLRRYWWLYVAGLVACTLLSRWYQASEAEKKAQRAAEYEAKYGVSRAELGEQWPYTVDSGYALCVQGIYPVFRPEGTDNYYALNGTALGGGYDHPRDSNIWKDDPSTGAKMSDAAILEAAQKHCD